MADVRKVVPRVVDGKIARRSAQQVFVETSSILTDGMCGGPVVATPGGAGKMVVGMTEGIVPIDSPYEDIRGHAVYVESHEILK